MLQFWTRDEVQQHLAAGVPNWLMVTPPRVSTTNRYHSDLLEQFQSYDDDIVMLVYLAPANLSPQALHFGVLTQYSPKTLCQSKHKVMVIIFLWDQWKIKNETQPYEEFCGEQAAKWQGDERPKPLALATLLTKNFKPL